MKEMKKIIAMAMAVSLAFATTAFAASVDYTRVYDYPLGQIDPAEYGEYVLWDLNNDGIAELIIGHGEYSANYVNDVYTVDEDGNPVYAGTIYSEQTFYQAPDENGLYAVYGHMGHEIITRVTMNGYDVVEEVVSDRQLGYDEDYYSSEARIAYADLDDRDLLDRWNYVD